MAEESKKFDGELKDYRQPFVTSLGIILGFLLSYLAGWANSADHSLLADGTDVAIFVTIVFAVILLVIALARMLSPRARTAPLAFYQRTLALYLAGIIVAFAGFLIAWLV